MLARDGDDRLPGKFRIRLLRSRRLSFSRVERRQIFRRRVINDLSMLELGYGCELRLQSDQTAKSDQTRDCDEVRDHGLGKTAPRQLPLHENIWPERRWRRTEIQLRKTIGSEETAQIVQESPRPGRHFQQQRWSRHWKPILRRPGLEHLPMVDAAARFAIALVATH